MACDGTNHDLVMISRISTGEPYTYEVTQWCRFCGGVVVDLEGYERIKPGGVMKMRFPGLAITYFKNVSGTP